jgi:hypothetical protein
LPPVRIVFYRNSRGRLLVLDWLRELRQREPVRYVHVAAALLELGALGRELGPPLSAHLADGLYELRAPGPSPGAPLLYFFREDEAVVLGPVLRESDPVPMLTLVRASRHRREYERDPLGRSHEEAPESEDL